jgi:hypothetical protein
MYRIVVDRAKKNVRTLFPPFLTYYLWINPISQDVYWSGFVLGGSSCRSGREAVSQYRYGARIGGSCCSGCIYYNYSGCGGERAGFVSVSGRHNNGDGRHDDGKRQQGGRRHDDSDGRHDDGKGVTGGMTPKYQRAHARRTLVVTRPFRMGGSLNSPPFCPPFGT